jgi:hypothetical protein
MGTVPFPGGVDAGSPTALASHTASRIQKRLERDAAQAFYVEFRAARNGVYGHSYVAYGELDARGTPASACYADVHPDGGFFRMAAGHFFPMRAETEPVEDTLRREVVSRYCRMLTPAEYRILTTAIARIRAACRFWNVLHYNCNDFCADVARAIGLRTPRTLMRPYQFIPTLRRLNEAEPSAAADTPAAIPDVLYGGGPIAARDAG